MEHTDRSAALAVQWLEAWMREWLAPDFVHVSPLGRFDGRDIYLDAVVPMARKSVVELRILDVISAGEQAAIRFENRTPYGAVESCDWVRVEAGRIREIRSYYDSTLVRQALSSEDTEPDTY